MARRIHLNLSTQQCRAVRDLSARSAEKARRMLDDEARERWHTIECRTTKQKPSQIMLTTIQVRAIHAASLERQRAAPTPEERALWEGVVKKTRDAIEFDDTTRSGRGRARPSSDRSTARAGGPHSLEDSRTRGAEPDHLEPRTSDLRAKRAS